MLNIASSSGTVTDSALTTVATISGTQQVSTTTTAFTAFTVGQKVNATVNGKDYSYTVTGNDIAAGGDTAVANVLNNAAAAYTAAGLTQAGTGVVVTVGTVADKGKLIFTATPNTKTFSVSTSTSTGGDYVTGNINTQADALAALTTVDAKLVDVNSGRSTLGATINRLTYAVDNLSNVSQNAAASRSRVEDTDYAKASTELARTQIISQAATAMLAQANQSQQSVLALLK
jgi:flagellin